VSLSRNDRITRLSYYVSRTATIMVQEQSNPTVRERRYVLLN